MDRDIVLAFAALAHPVRLRILRHLVRCYPLGVPAGEIGRELSVKPSTLSGYLAQLAEAGLIVQDRHGTSLRYRVAPAQIERLNAAWIKDVCLGRGLPPVPANGARVYNLLFLGRGNGGPSLMAEALMRDRAGARYEVFSAGVAPSSEVPAGWLGVLRRSGLDADLLWAKPVAEFLAPDAPRLDVVITLGATARRRVPVFDGLPVVSGWGLPAGLSDGALLARLGERIAAFAQLDPARATRAQLQAALDGPP